MAFYRCGGGGIPSSLKTDMNAVLNKKFGTSSDYPPADWAPTVNLMGPLPEKTIVSSPIADFSDGADDVPTKSLVVTIPPTLSGVSQVVETQTGRNLASELLEWNATNRVISPVFLKSGTYTVSFQRSVTPSAIYIRKGDNIMLSGNAYATKYNSNSFTFTADESTYYYVQIYRNASSTTWEEAPVTNAQIELGSTAHAYEPYQTPTQYTSNLGRTIYGGTADIVNGVGTDENGNDFTFDGQEIPTRLGYNAFWSDSGDTEVTYRADINLALGGQ